MLGLSQDGIDPVYSKSCEDRLSCYTPHTATRMYPPAGEASGNSFLAPQMTHIPAIDFQSDFSRFKQVGKHHVPSGKEILAAISTLSLSIHPWVGMERVMWGFSSVFQNTTI